MYEHVERRNRQREEAYQTKIDKERASVYQTNRNRRTSLCCPRKIELLSTFRRKLAYFDPVK